MGFNLRSGNSSGLKFKQMGSSPNKHKRFSKSPGDKNDHGPELKHQDTYEAHNEPRPTEDTSPNKMDPSMIMSIAGSMGDKGGGGGGGGSAEPDKKGMTLNVDKHE